MFKQLLMFNENLTKGIIQTNDIEMNINTEEKRMKNGEFTYTQDKD